MNTLCALSTLLALIAIGACIWAIALKRKKPGADIERQIATLRKGADHSVATRPRVRAISQNSVSGGGVANPAAASTPIKTSSTAHARKPKACGGGQCRHQADCSDVYCPSRLAASLSGKSQ